MSLQAYGLTGRKRKTDYVGAIEAQRPSLARKKEIADTAAYREKSLALQKDRIKAEKDASTKASIIGLGQLGMSSYFGRKKDKALEDVISGGTGKAAEGAVTPTATTGEFGEVTGGGPGEFGEVAGPSGAPSGFMTGLKSAGKNWGSIAGSSLSGGAVGGEVAARMFGDNTLTRVIGGGVVAGGLGYMATGDPYSAGLSFLFGGGTAALFG